MYKTIQSGKCTVAVVCACSCSVVLCVVWSSVERVECLTALILCYVRGSRDTDWSQVACCKKQHFRLILCFGTHFKQILVKFCNLGSLDDFFSKLCDLYFSGKWQKTGKKPTDRV